MKRTIFFLSNVGASKTYEYYRQWLPCEMLAAKFPNCQIIISDWKELSERGLASVDVLVCGLSPSDSLTQHILNGFHGRLIWDIDDNLFAGDGVNPAWHLVKTKTDNLHDILERADLIWTTTEKLSQQLGYQAKTRICPNLIDWRQVPAFRERISRDVVWWGSDTHRKDLELIEPLPLLLSDRNYIFYGILPDDWGRWEVGVGAASAERIPTLRNVGLIPGTAFSRFYPTIRAMPGGVGICPLLNNEFNEGKSCLKFLEMAAMGLPVVASRCLPYSDVIYHGKTGFLVNGIDEWVSCIREAIERPEVALAGYEFVKNFYSWQSQGAYAWRDAFEEAANPYWSRQPAIRWAADC